MGTFGPNKNEAWQAFAESMGADFIEGKTFKSLSKVRLKYKTWDLVLDTYTVSTGNSTVTYTRVRAVYVRAAEFGFKLFRTTVFTKAARALGRSYALTGDESFDGEFSIRSDYPDVIKKLFANDTIKQTIFGIKRVYFYVKRAKGAKDTKMVDNESELQYYTAGVIKDGEQLTLIFGAIINLLDALEANGIAENEVPKISYV